MSQRRYYHDLALLHPDKPKLLGIPRDGTLTLPRHTSDDELETPELLTALRDMVPLGTFMLRPACRWPAEAKKDDDRTILYVLEARTAGPLPEGARWLNLEMLGELSYPEVAALETVLREDAEPENVPALRPAWMKRGWLEEVKVWLERELTRLGRTPIGELEQVRHWSLSPSRASRRQLPTFFPTSRRRCWRLNRHAAGWCSSPYAALN